jgi:hypothetical protein
MHTGLTRARMIRLSTLCSPFARTRACTGPRMACLHGGAAAAPAAPLYAGLPLDRAAHVRRGARASCSFGWPGSPAPQGGLRGAPRRRAPGGLRRKDAERLRQLAASPAATLVPVSAGRSLVCGEGAAVVPLAAAQGLLTPGTLTFLGLRPGDGAAVFAAECEPRVNELAHPAGQARRAAAPAPRPPLAVRELARPRRRVGQTCGARGPAARRAPRRSWRSRRAWSAGTPPTGSAARPGGRCARCRAGMPGARRAPPAPPPAPRRGLTRRATPRRAPAADEGGSGAGPTVYPRIDPAVIALVTCDGHALLGRQARWPPGRYSLLAGARPAPPHEALA